VEVREVVQDAFDWDKEILDKTIADKIIVEKVI